jgi:hypothetical protein
MEKKMRILTKMMSVFLLLIFICLAFVACSSSEDEAESEVLCTDLASVDGVTVAQQSGGTYAVVSGFFPDACTQVSDVGQQVQEDRFEITICTASPPDMMCAQMITPFELEILLETGGLEPGEYNVVVNNTASATFMIQ